MLRAIILAFELLILTALVLATRCANYQEVFVSGNIYFTDADCYARMTRVRICAEHPGTIVRHHDFENFPIGTRPHTTAPLDYLIVALSICLKTLTSQPLDLAGAMVSPLLALITAWFLWWWTRRMRFSFRWAALFLFALSPILVHGTELGRPDHQSLLILLLTIAFCAEWSLQTEPGHGWSIVGGIAWGLALWVSVYEPLILLVLVILIASIMDRVSLFGKERRAGWIVFALVIVIALLVERRVPTFSFFASSNFFENWSRAIGELAHVSLFNRIWFVWAGYLIAIVPIAGWISIRKRISPPNFLIGLLVATFALTIWQARWSYFFVLLVVIALPRLLEVFRPRFVVWTAFALSFLPVLNFWDAQLWPNESEVVRRAERRNESGQVRELAETIRSDEKNAFLAPWWVSPSISYWSGQPGVAGSSHESLNGTVDTARLYFSTDPEQARQLLRDRQVRWVFAYDWQRVGQNCADLLGSQVPEQAIGRTLDRTPGQAPRFLALSGQNGTGKLFRFADKL